MSKPNESENDMTEAVASLLVIVGTPLWYFIGAYVDSWLWLWFAVPLGAPPLTLAHVMGIGILVRSFITKPENDVKAMRILVHAIVVPPIYLGLGWVAHWLMVPR